MYASDKINTKITRYGYVIEKKTLPETVLIQIKSDLTVRPYQSNRTKKSENFLVYQESNEYIAIPRFYGIERFGIPKINRLEENVLPKRDMEYIGSLRTYQVAITDTIIKGLDKDGGGLMVVGCGKGKTNMALFIACHYKLKTLILTHKTFLKRQVINRIKSTTNVPEKKIGIIQQRTCNVKNKLFVIGMIQTIAKKKYSADIIGQFGMIIIDEVHHMSAKNFSRVLLKMSAKYMLGMSAEISRNDKTYHVINWFMGPVLYYEDQPPNDKVIVKKFMFYTMETDLIKMIYDRTGEPMRPTMITNLVEIDSRNRFIIDIVMELIKMKRKILCLSGRLEHVYLIQRALKAKDVGLYIGGMKEDELNESATKQVILGTYNMAEEGLDIPDLDVVLLLTPKSKVKQSIGRVLRKEDYSIHPLVIDIVDYQNPSFKGQSKTRKTYYRNKKYNIQSFNVSDTPQINHNLSTDIDFIKKSLTDMSVADPVVRKQKTPISFNISFLPSTYDDE